MHNTISHSKHISDTNVPELIIVCAGVKSLAILVTITDLLDARY